MHLTRRHVPKAFLRRAAQACKQRHIDRRRYMEAKAKKEHDLRKDDDLTASGKRNSSGEDGDAELQTTQVSMQ